MFGKSRNGNPYRERDAQGAKLKRALSLAICARNRAEITRIRARLQSLGIPA